MAVKMTTITITATKITTITITAIMAHEQLQKDPSSQRLRFFGRQIGKNHNDMDVTSRVRGHEESRFVQETAIVQGKEYL